MASPSQLFKDISAGRFKSAYYFFGAEDYRIVEAEKFVARNFLPDMQLKTNLQRIDGRKTKADDIVVALSNLPMLGEKQVFVVSEFQSFRPKEIERITKLLSPTDPSRVIIFSSPSARTPKKNSAFFKRMVNIAEAVEFNRLSLDESARMVRQRLKSEGITIDQPALQHLLELVSGSRGGLESELNKLTNFKQSGENITLEDIKKIAAGYEVFNIFAVADLIIQGDSRRVMQTVQHLIAEGNTPVSIVTLLQQHFLCLYLVKNGKPPLGNRHFLIPKFRQQSSRFDNEQLERAIIDIAETDSQLRRSAVKLQTQVEMLALGLATAIKSRNG